MENIEPFFQKYRDDVYRLALSYTRNSAEAEDVCQTVFLKLMEQKSISAGKEKQWLMQVTANQCRSLLRSAWWRKTTSMEVETTPVEMGEYRYVYHAVMTLPPKYRVVVYLHYFEMLTTGEISTLLRISQSAVTTRLNRARNMLKDLLKEESV